MYCAFPLVFPGLLYIYQFTDLLDGGGRSVFEHLHSCMYVYDSCSKIFVYSIIPSSFKRNKSRLCKHLTNPTDLYYKTFTAVVSSAVCKMVLYASLSHPSLLFAEKAKTTLREWTLIKVSSCLAYKYQNRVEMTDSYRLSTLLIQIFNYGLYYKTLCGRNYLCTVVSQSVCNCQPFTPQSIVFVHGWEPTIRVGLSLALLYYINYSNVVSQAVRHSQPLTPQSYICGQDQETSIRVGLHFGNL